MAWASSPSTGRPTATPRATGCSTRSTRPSTSPAPTRRCAWWWCAAPAGCSPPATTSARPRRLDYRKALGAKPGIQTYDQFKKYNLDLLLKWRNFPKPTIAMVEGYCIYAGWMLAAAMDVVFAADDAEFLAGFVEYMSIPWDIGVRRAKELVLREPVHLAPRRPRATAWSTACCRRPTWSARPSPGPRRVAREQPRGAAHGQDPDEQGAGRPGLHQGGGGHRSATTAP